jgi:hypothetical protein
MLMNEHLIDTNHMDIESLTPEDLYNEIADLARDQGIGSREDWNNLVDEVLESHLTLGELNSDQEIEGHKDDLYLRWETYKRLAGQETPDALSEDPDAPRE